MLQINSASNQIKENCKLRLDSSKLFAGSKTQTDSSKTGSIAYEHFFAEYYNSSSKNCLYNISPKRGMTIT